ncbi:tyrosine-type recombinase/integrase [Nanoarchaeota archaeon]
MDIHQYDQKLEATIRGIDKANISDKNKAILHEMTDSLVLEGLSKPRIMKYIEVVRVTAKKLNKDLDKVTEKDLKKHVSELQQSSYSMWTKHVHKVIIRRFFKWLLKTPGKDYPDLVSWISIRKSKSEMKLPSDTDLLNEEDVQKLIKVADQPRDRAFVSVLWESGARVGEIGNMKIGNVVFDKHGTVLYIKGKTGARKIRLISSTPLLSAWISSHPARDNKDFPLWINIGTKGKMKMIRYCNIRKILNILFEKAGIKKRCNPHLFRHSRATFMANHLTEFQMNQYFGWIQGSDMPATYVHMSGREVDDAILTMNGMKPQIKGAEQKLKPIICPRCDTINTADAQHCNKCGGILDLKYAMELEETTKKEKEMRSESDEVMNRLFKDKEVQEFLAGKLKSLGLSL